MMRRPVLRAAAVAAVVVLGPAGAAQASFYGRKTAGGVNQAATTNQGPVQPADIDIIENLGQKVPAGLTFTDGRGGKVELDKMLGQGKPVVVTLGYYKCPMLCNLVHEGLAKGIKTAKMQPGKDFLGLAVSINPDEDPKSANTQQARLLRYLQHDNRADWPFVLDRSPETAAAVSLAKAVGFRYKYDPESKQFAHAAVAFVLTPSGTIARYIYGVDFPARDLRLALVEASGGRVGTSLDRIILSCFKYDPMAKRYTPYAMAFVRIGAGLCFLALVGLLAVLWRRELVMRRRRLAAT